MLKNPEDRRARRSRKLLKESLLELMKCKTFSDISVRDITDAADMNRATFYLHYSGTAELRGPGLRAGAGLRRGAPGDLCHPLQRQ